MECRLSMKNMDNFEMEILSLGRQKSFLPMTFLKEGEEIKVYYREGEYRKLSEEDIRQPYVLMDVLENLILKIAEAEKHLLFWDGYFLSLENIYVNTEDGDIRIKYAPRRKDERKKVRSEGFALSFVELLQYISYESKVAQEYLAMLKDEIHRNRLSMKGIGKKIHEIKREIYECGWADRDCP